MAAAAGRDVNRLCLHAGFEKYAPRRGFVDRRAHPDIFPGHLQGVIHRILAVHDRFDAHARIHVQPPHKPIELAEWSLRMNPAFRQDLPFQDYFRVGDARHRHGFAVGEPERFIAQAAGEGQFIDAEIGFERRRHKLVGMRADGDRNRQRLLFRQGALGELAHIVRRDDIDAGDVSFLEHQPIHARVHAELRVFGDDHGAGDHRPAVHDREYRHGQIVKVHFFACHNDFFHRCIRDPLGFNGLVHGATELVRDIVVGDAHPERDTVARL